MVEDKITVILVTSVLPSHPSTHIVDETIQSIRKHLPKAEIIMQIDGLREEQIDRKEDYDNYKSQILWDCLHKYDNVLPIVFDEFSHQTDMMKQTIDLIKTPLMLYVEGDCPLVTDRHIDWQRCIDYIEDGSANTIRFHFENVLPKEHLPLMIGQDGLFLKTIQWSQRPHLSSVVYYRDTVLPTVRERFFIEDTYHGVVMNDWYTDGKYGWNKHKLVIYYPDDGVNIARSYTTDGREGGLKFTSDDEVWQK